MVILLIKIVIKKCVETLSTMILIWLTDNRLKINNCPEILEDLRKKQHK